MGCACGGKGSQKNVKYIYTDSKGVQKVFPSEISARAASLRDQNRGSIRTVPA